MLTTARLGIRPCTLEDVPDATSAVGLLLDSDEKNRDWIAKHGIEHQREHGYAYWQCRDRGTGQLLGFCGWREHDLGASLGYAFAEPSRGNGLAKEAAGAAVAWGLDHIGADRLYASVRPPNPASCKVLEHAGMTLVREYVDDHGPRLVYTLPGRRWPGMDLERSTDWSATTLGPDASDTAFDIRLARLRANLDEAGTLLRDHGETRWLRWVVARRTQLDSHDPAVFEALLGAFGGMGSFDDLVIMGANGHLVRPEDEAAVNERLAHLREAIWDDGTFLRHDLRGSP